MDNNNCLNNTARTQSSICTRGVSVNDASQKVIADTPRPIQVTNDY